MDALDAEPGGSDVLWGDVLSVLEVIDPGRRLRRARRLSLKRHRNNTRQCLLGVIVC